MTRVDGRFRPFFIDLALGVTAAAINVAGALDEDAGIAYEFHDGDLAWLLLLNLVLGLALILRRHQPLAVFLAYVGGLGVITLVGWNPGMLPFTLLVATYSLGAWGRTRDCVLGLGAMYAVMGVALATQVPYFDSWFSLSIPVTNTLPCLLGIANRARREAGERSLERARALEAARVVEIERSEARERLRVARELHDVVTNSLSAIAVQAGSARMRVAEGPVKGLFEEIEAAAHEALEDLRRVLGVLRERTSYAETSAEPMHGNVHPAEPTRSLLVNDRATDLALGLTAAVINVAGVLIPETSTSFEYRVPNAMVLGTLAAIAGLSLSARRTRPVTVLVVNVACLSVVSLAGWQTGTMPGCVLVAIYAMGAWTPIRRSLGALVAMWAYLLALGLVVEHLELDLVESWITPGTPLLFSLPWVVGLAIRFHRRDAAQAGERAIEAAHRNALEVERARSRERLRLSRELHDVVSHTLSSVAVQAGVAGHLVVADSDEISGPALVAIEDQSRVAMGDLRQMLGVLDAHGYPAPMEPNPGLEDLATLAARHRLVHGPVELAIDPALCEMPASLGLTVYRVVQEALTNVGKHAPGACTRVAVRAASSGLVVTVEDDGPERVVVAVRDDDDVARGHGLDGMRERVAMFDGTLCAEPKDESGFLVRAELCWTPR